MGLHSYARGLGLVTRFPLVVLCCLCPAAPSLAPVLCVPPCCPHPTVGPACTYMAYGRGTLRKNQTTSNVRTNRLAWLVCCVFVGGRAPLDDAQWGWLG